MKYKGCCNQLDHAAVTHNPASCPNCRFNTALQHQSTPSEGARRPGTSRDIGLRHLMMGDLRMRDHGSLLLKTPFATAESHHPTWMRPACIHPHCLGGAFRSHSYSHSYLGRGQGVMALGSQGLWGLDTVPRTGRYRAFDTTQALNCRFRVAFILALQSTEACRGPAPTCRCR